MMAVGLKEMMQDARSKVAVISPEDLSQSLADGETGVVVDVRETEEFRKGHVPGALNIPRGWLEIRADDRSPLADPTLVADRGARIVTYCWQAPGVREFLSARTLGDMGYTNVVALDGGLKGWKERGLPIETGAPVGG